MLVSRKKPFPITSERSATPAGVTWVCPRAAITSVLLSSGRWPAFTARTNWFAALASSLFLVSPKLPVRAALSDTTM